MPLVACRYEKLECNYNFKIGKKLKTIMLIIWDEELFLVPEDKN